MRNPLAIFRSRRMAVVLLLGFSSGLPLMLTGQTIQQWLLDAKVDLKSIATFAAVGLPYTTKFLWAPLLDRYTLPFLGRRRGWLLVFQVGLVGGLIFISCLDPKADPELFALAALIVATLSASQDIVVDAYNTDLLDPEQRAAGSATYVMGYRTAMLASGAMALVMADHLLWQVVYLIMAGLMVIGIVGTLLAEEPKAHVRPPRTLASAVVEPFIEFFTRFGWRQALVVLGFAATYKFGEQFAQNMVQPFYRSVGFTKTEIGLASKAVSYFGVAVGGAISGVLVARYGVRKMLVVFGCIQIGAHVAYLAIAFAGHDIVVFAIAIFVEYVVLAMAAMTFVAAQMSMCSPAVSATQMALLTSLSSVGQRVFGTFGADVVGAVGWKGFFVVTMAMGLPGIVLAWFAMHDPPPAAVFVPKARVVE